MTLIIKSFLFFFLILLISCNSSKKSSETESSINETKMIEKGFQKAVVIFSENEKVCPFTLSVEGVDYLLDPINLEKTFKVNQEKIWVNYRPLRMANRCDKATPVEIIEIEKRQ
ncbi:hypothetical protein [uncultured Planktosalinus sp.]|uniref:hypothetical protein n=1 Tax=uncultured Planktosalinus sp. TaxID=1810935 RepID=UPI0030DB206E|tara:strand:+ start:64 stop:405 length:342 start_codon:yes stop_codon:yes gene_type:complete